MDISDYSDKMLDILSDNKKFLPLDSPRDIIDVKREVDKMLKLLKKNNLIATEVYSQLKPIGTRIPYLLWSTKDT